MIAMSLIPGICGAAAAFHSVSGSGFVCVGSARITRMNQPPSFQRVISTKQQSHPLYLFPLSRRNGKKEGSSKKIPKLKKGELSATSSSTPESKSRMGKVKTKVRDFAKSVIGNTAQRPIEAPVPQAIAALIRDSAQAAVEAAIEDIIAPAIRKQDDIAVDLSDVATTAEAYVEGAVMDRARDAAMNENVLAGRVVVAAERVSALAIEASDAARLAASKANDAIAASEDAKLKARQAVEAADVLKAITAEAVTATKAAASFSSLDLASKVDFEAVGTRLPESVGADAVTEEDVDALSFDDVDYSLSSMAPPFIGEDQCLVPGEAVVRIENAPQNSRRIFAGIDIMVSVDEVWKVLTDYEHLQRVVPNLVTNDVLQLYEGDENVYSNPLPLESTSSDHEQEIKLLSEKMKGARLKQIGGAKVVGINFSARTTLDVREWPQGLPDFGHYDDEVYEGQTRDKRATNEKSQPLLRYRFPRPFAVCNLPHRDISMQSIEKDDGEFRMYQGVWRLQPLPGCAPEGGNAMRLTYAVEISPRAYLPVRLVEGRIAQDLCANLKAIREFVTPTS